jgi:hypothetical protein
MLNEHGDFEMGVLHLLQSVRKNPDKLDEGIRYEMVKLNRKSRKGTRAHTPTILTAFGTEAKSMAYGSSNLVGH